jgi:ankyrin repeat protein
MLYVYLKSFRLVSPTSGEARSLRQRINMIETPLLWAADKGHEVVVKLLLEKGAELETKDNYGQTPLLWAVEREHEAVVKLLVEKLEYSSRLFSIVNWH